MKPYTFADVVSAVRLPETATALLRLKLRILRPLGAGIPPPDLGPPPGIPPPDLGPPPGAQCSDATCRACFSTSFDLADTLNAYHANAS